MSEPYHNETYRMRVTGLPEDVAQRLAQELTVADIKVTKWQDTDTFVVVWSFRETDDYMRQIGIVKALGVSENQFGIWISLVTECGSDGIHVAAHVLAAIRVLGGQLDFSFTKV